MVQTGHYSAAQQTRLTKTANYFERNLPYMDYPTYLKHGWPIASGVIEGACRHFVKDRCELSGMRWERTGVENLLRLRAVAENDDWDDYHHFRKRQRHLYITHLIQNNRQSNFKLWNPTLSDQYGLRQLLIKLNRPSRIVPVQTIITTSHLLLDGVQLK